MYRSVVLFILLIANLPVLAQGQRNLDLLDRWFSDTILTNSTLARFNDCWGFTKGNDEYAVIGSTMGTHVFRISDDDELLPVDFKAGRHVSSMVVHRDFKTYKNYLYAVCDEGNSSLQVFDTDHLPDSLHLVNDVQTNFGRVHNIFIDTNNALLYACMVTELANGNPVSMIPLRVFSLSDPVHPQLLYSGPNDIPEVHDCYVRNNMAILNCGFDGLRVYDFSNPAFPQFKQNLNFYQDQGYNHQGWLSPDGTRYVFGDETNGKRLKNCVVDSEGKITVKNYFGTNYQEGSVPHNIMITDEFAFVAYYNEGFHIYDLRQPVPKEVAFYDTYPTENVYKLNGAWGVFAQFPSGRILVSDRQYGLFLFSFKEKLFSTDLPDEASVFPNPVASDENYRVVLADYTVETFSVEVYASDGRQLDGFTQHQYSLAELPAPYSPGSYFLRISWTDNNNTVRTETRRLVVY